MEEQVITGHFATQPQVSSLHHASMVPITSPCVGKDEPFGPSLIRVVPEASPFKSIRTKLGKRVLLGSAGLMKKTSSFN